MKTRLTVSSLVLPLALAACAGGGGGGGSSTPVAPPPAPVPVTVSGDAVGSTYTLNNSTLAATISPSPVDTATTLTTTGLVGRNGATGNVTSATINSTNAAVAAPGTSLTVNSSSSNSLDKFVVTDPNSQIVGNTAAITVATSTIQQYSYLTYGTWSNCGSGCGTTAETGVAGWFVAGQNTPFASIPTSGTATYNGSTDGNFFNGGASQRVRSDLAVTATFGNGSGSLGFATSNSEFVNQQGTFLALATGLNMTGTLTYSGTNSFSGSVTAVGMTGTATGRFYGPTVGVAPNVHPAEIGGVYSLSGGGQTNIGSFVAN